MWFTIGNEQDKQNPRESIATQVYHGQVRSPTKLGVFSPLAIEEH